MRQRLLKSGGNCDGRKFYVFPDSVYAFGKRQGLIKSAPKGADFYSSL